MSGQLLWGPASTARRAHTHAVFALGDDELRFVDPRTFGEIVPGPGDPLIASVAKQGPDALTLDAFGWKGVLAGRRTALKTLITDQQRIAGIGNIYADEICHRAGFRPARAADTLPRAAAERLGEATRDILSSSIAAGGSSLSDEQYVDLAGRPGRYQHEHRVHARAGEPCGSCGAPVHRQTLAGRGTYWCSRCQK